MGIDLVAACPRRTLGLDDDNRVVLVRPEECIFDDELSTKAKEMGRKDMIKVRMDTNTFIFKVEAVTKDGPRTAIDVVRASLRILDYKLSLFSQDAYGDPIKDGDWLPRRAPTYQY